MARTLTALRRLFGEEHGQTAVECAVILSLVIVLSSAAVRTIGTNATSAFAKIPSSLSGVADGGSGSRGNSGTGNASGNHDGDDTSVNHRKR